MEIGFTQLFWVVIILAVFLVSAIKRFKRQKQEAQLANGEDEIDESGEIETDRPGNRQKSSNWDSFISEALGLEPEHVQIRKPDNKEPGKLYVPEIETENESIVAESDETKKDRDAVGTDVQELANHHLTSNIEENAFGSTFDESDSGKPGTVCLKETGYCKTEKTGSYVIDRSSLKKAIIYSEIIGPPVSLRSRKNR